MIGTLQCWLNQHGLSDIDDSVFIHDISYQPPKFNTRTFSIAGNHGTGIARNLAQYGSVEITVEIHEYDIVRRQHILQEIAKWALGGGEFTANDRPGQRLIVECVNPPSLGSAMNWTDEIKIELVANRIPFWEGDEVQTEATGAAETLTMNILGVADRAYVDADIVTGAAITSFTLISGDTSIALRQLNIASGKTIHIYHDEYNLLQIECDGTSLLGKRTSESSDDLRAENGAASFYFSSSGECTITVKARPLFV